jgi:hypothetical protein
MLTYSMLLHTTRVEYLGDYLLRLDFSNGEYGADLAPEFLLELMSQQRKKAA